MAERNETHLRGVKSAKTRKKARPQPVDPGVAALAERVLALDTKLREQDGIEGVSANLQQLQSAVLNVPTEVLDATRAQIRELIASLLKINNELQTLLRIKKQITHE